MTKIENTLICISEECGEVIKCISKILRFGIDGGYGGERNIDRLYEELIDLAGVIELAKDRGIITSKDNESELIRKKIEKVKYHEDISKGLGIMNGDGK